MNEKTAVEDFERKVYRVESVQPCGRSLALDRGPYGGRKVRAHKAQEFEIQTKSEPGPFIQGVVSTVTETFSYKCLIKKKKSAL